MPVFRSCATVFAVALRYFSPTRTEEDSLRSQWFKKILKVSCRLLFLSALFVFLSNAVFELQNLCRRQEWLSAGRPGCRLSENTARPEYSRPTTLCRSSGNKKKSTKKLCKNSFWVQNFVLAPNSFEIIFSVPSSVPYRRHQDLIRFWSSNFRNFYAQIPSCRCPSACGSSRSDLLTEQFSTTSSAIKVSSLSSAKMAISAPFRKSLDENLAACGNDSLTPCKSPKRVQVP